MNQVKFLNCADTVCTILKVAYDKSNEVKYNLRDLARGYKKMVKGITLSVD